MAYQDESKSPAVALMLELFLFPGVGSIYAGHPQGAFITWAGTIGGFVLLIEGIDHYDDNRTNHTQPNTLIVAGVASLIGFRIFGLVDSWSSASDYNADLSHRLGLTLNVAPLVTRQSVAWGPSLSLRF